MGITTAPYSAFDLLVSVGTFTTDTPMSLEDFGLFCAKFPDLIVERKASGKVIVMSPVKSKSGENEGHLFGYVYAWNLGNNKPGVAYSPSTGFLLGEEEVRSGDAVWVSNEHLAPFVARPDHGDDWVTVTPDFVVELRSKSDRIKKLKKKMVETWMAHGVRLAWLIDPKKEVAYIYRQGQKEPEEVSGFADSVLSGEDVLAGFRFPLVELNL